MEFEKADEKFLKRVVAAISGGKTPLIRAALFSKYVAQNLSFAESELMVGLAGDLVQELEPEISRLKAEVGEERDVLLGQARELKRVCKGFVVYAEKSGMGVVNG